MNQNSEVLRRVSTVAWSFFIIACFQIIFFIAPITASAATKAWTSGSGVWTVPAGVTTLDVQVIGGGGAGAGGTNEGTGGGGGGGGYSRRTISVTPGQTIAYSVGGPGIPGTSYVTPHCEPGADASSYPGGDSRFGTVIAYGGQAGQTQGYGGAGGWGSTMSGANGVTMDRWNYNGGNGGRSGHNVSYGVGSICSGYVEAGYVGGSCPGAAVPAGYGPSYGSGGGGVGMWGTCDWSSAYVYYPGAGGAGYVRVNYTVDPGGTINVSSNVASSWTITGPRTVSGSGTSGTYTAMPSGTYTIAWSDVEWYNKFPTGQSLTLSPGGTITFNGTYSEVVSGTWTAPSCPSSCGLSSSYQPYVCSGGEWIYNGRCRAPQPADIWCPGTAACVVPTGTWTAPSCPTACGTPATTPSYYCSGGNGLCSTYSPATLWCPATAACPAPNLTSQNFTVPSSIMTNNVLNFSANVANIGDLSTSIGFKDNFSYKWGVSGSWTDLPLISKSPLAASASSLDSGSYTPTSPGSLYIQHCTDSNREISESDESNCVVSGAITVSAPVCTGTEPTGASRCSATEPTVNTPYTLLSSCSWSGLTKCHYSCDSGYITSGSSCVRTQCNNGIDDDGDGGVDSSGPSADTGCTDINDNDESVPPELSVSRRTVSHGDSTTLSWNLNGNTGCTLTGGGKTFNLLLGTSSSTPINARTTFTLRCAIGSDSETVDVSLTGVES